MYRRVIAAALACVAAATLASVVPASPAAMKQRIAIVERVNLAGSGTFELLPLTPGPLKRDSGRVTGTGTHNGSTIRDGQRLTLISGTDAMTGKRGTFRVSQIVESAEVGGGYRAITGTWSLNIYTTTGAYKGFIGGGRFLGIEFPGNRLIIRQRDSSVRISPERREIGGLRSLGSSQASALTSARHLAHARLEG